MSSKKKKLTISGVAIIVSLAVGYDRSTYMTEGAKIISGIASQNLENYSTIAKKSCGDNKNPSVCNLARSEAVKSYDLLELIRNMIEDQYPFVYFTPSTQNELVREMDKILTRYEKEVNGYQQAPQKNK